MNKAHDLIGLPVITLDSGTQIGTVKDFIIDLDWKVQGALVDSKQWFSPVRYIGWDAVAAFGSDAVTVSDEDSILVLEDTAPYLFLLTGNGKIKGMPIFTVGGEQLGELEDVYFSKDMGKQIMGFEVSEGFISDLKEGRKKLPFPDGVTVGSDAIIVPVHCKELLENFVTNEE